MHALGSQSPHTAYPISFWAFSVLNLKPLSLIHTFPREFGIVSGEPRPDFCAGTLGSQSPYTAM